jgi:hypothetical protein
MAATWRLRVESESFDWNTGTWSVDRVVVDSLTTEADALAQYGRTVAQFIADRPYMPRRHLVARIERRQLYTDKWIKTQVIRHRFTD